MAYTARMGVVASAATAAPQQQQQPRHGVSSPGGPAALSPLPPSHWGQRLPPPSLAAWLHLDSASNACTVPSVRLTDYPMLPQPAANQLPAQLPGPVQPEAWPTYLVHSLAVRWLHVPV